MVRLVLLRRATVVPAGLLLALLAAACGLAPRDPGWIPGLGEIMSLQQMRHAKLWYAGSAGNWAVAAYELDELEEGFEDAVELHPTHKDSPVPIAQIVPLKVDEPLARLRSVVEARDADAFPRAFDRLTSACNDCHQATDFGFNVVQRPGAGWYSNQRFAPASDDGP